jgi:hypothetical protein
MSGAMTTAIHKELLLLGCTFRHRATLVYYVLSMIVMGFVHTAGNAKAANYSFLESLQYVVAFRKVVAWIANRPNLVDVFKCFLEKHKPSANLVEREAVMTVVMAIFYVACDVILTADSACPTSAADAAANVCEWCISLKSLEAAAAVEAADYMTSVKDLVVNIYESCQKRMEVHLSSGSMMLPNIHELYEYPPDSRETLNDFDSYLLNDFRSTATLYIYDMIGRNDFAVAVTVKTMQLCLMNLPSPPSATDCEEFLAPPDVDYKKALQCHIIDTENIIAMHMRRGDDMLQKMMTKPMAAMFNKFTAAEGDLEKMKLKFGLLKDDIIKLNSDMSTERRRGNAVKSGIQEQLEATKRKMNTVVDRLNSLKEKLRAELLAELKAELKGELLAELKAELLAELKGELLAELKGELLAELKGELLAELKQLAE